ncbi:MAG TPA: hypothetical protein VFA17_07300 [Thermoplasmata archaeon]|nr:hypothetical protein [Thermoplasmata archaeon]
MGPPKSRSRQQPACSHSVEFLGSSVLMEFYRCRQCRQVIVVQGPRSWTFKPASLR